MIPLQIQFNSSEVFNFVFTQLAIFFGVLPCKSKANWDKMGGKSTNRARNYINISPKCPCYFGYNVKGSGMSVLSVSTVFFVGHESTSDISNCILNTKNVLLISNNFDFLKFAM